MKQEQAVGGLLIAALVHEDLVAVALEHGALSRKDGILAARQAVMAMHEENFHRERPPLSAFLARMGIDGLLCYYNLFWGWVQDGGTCFSWAAAGCPHPAGTTFYNGLPPIGVPFGTPKGTEKGPATSDSAGGPA